MKRYTSFDEIDKDLKFLRLKSKIDKEELRLGIHNIKEEVSETFSPINLISSALGAFLKKAFVLRILEKTVNKAFGIRI